MKSESTTFTVRGRGQFPIDMLRYDCCYPRTGNDVANIEGDPAEVRDVTLRTTLRAVTTERWRSFGWVVTDIRKD